MHGYCNSWFGAGQMPMMLIWIVVIGVVLWVVLSPKGVSSMNRETPLDIAKGRYAKGEITQKELDDIKRNL